MLQVSQEVNPKLTFINPLTHFTLKGFDMQLRDCYIIAIRTKLTYLIVLPKCKTL